MFTLINERPCDNVNVVKKKGGGINVTGIDVFTNIVHSEYFKNEKQLINLYTEEFDLEDIDDNGNSIIISERQLERSDCECDEYCIECDCRQCLSDENHDEEIDNIYFRTVELKNDVIKMFVKGNIIVSILSWNNEKIVTSFKVEVYKRQTKHN